MAIVQDNTLDKIDKNILSSIISVIVHRVKLFRFSPTRKRNVYFTQNRIQKCFENM